MKLKSIFKFVGSAVALYLTNKEEVDAVAKVVKRKVVKKKPRT